MKMMTLQFMALMLLASVAFVAKADTTLRANVPQAFEAGETVLPAGLYQITVPAAKNGAMRFQNVETGDSAFVFADAAGKENGVSLVQVDRTWKLTVPQAGTAQNLAIK
jgi:hypothetical protein